MSVLMGTFLSDEACDRWTDLAAPAGPTGPSNTESVKLEDGVMTVAHLRNAPLKGSRYFENDRYAACLAGDLVGVREVPFEAVLTCLDSGDLSGLSDLRGNFAVAAYDKQARKVHLVSDRKAQQPFYYLLLPDGLLFSTEISPFCRLRNRPKFDRKWLYEVVFFNFPVAGATFLEGVTRVPPGSVLTYEIATKRCSIKEYAPRFRRASSLLTGKAALERGLSVIRARVPEYAKGTNGPIALGLSGGWDSRAILPFLPLDGSPPMRTYTYGIPGCYDLRQSPDIAAKLALPHRQIPFDDEFVAMLPGLMPEGVFLSSGLLSILRATMLYVQKKVLWEGEGFPVTITGISADTLFRGHANVPAGISRAMLKILRTGKPEIGTEPFKSIFGDAYDDFRSHTAVALEGLRERYGDFDRTDFHLSYLVYEIAPKLIAGEMVMANRFTTFRVPFWDEDIIQLAHEIEFSTLSSSRFTLQPWDWQRENKLHAYLMASNPAVARIPVEDIPFNVVLAPKPFLKLYQLLIARPRRALRKIRRPRRVPLIAWDQWVEANHEMLVDGLLFSDKSCIREYLNPEFVRNLRGGQKTYWVGKLATAELAFRVAQNGWRSVP